MQARAQTHTRTHTLSTPEHNGIHMWIAMVNIATQNSWTSATICKLTEHHKKSAKSEVTCFFARSD